MRWMLEPVTALSANGHLDLYAGEDSPSVTSNITFLALGRAPVDPTRVEVRICNRLCTRQLFISTEAHNSELCSCRIGVFYVSLHAMPFRSSRMWYVIVPFAWKHAAAIFIHRLHWLHRRLQPFCAWNSNLKLPPSDHSVPCMVAGYLRCERQVSNDDIQRVASLILVP